MIKIDMDAYIKLNIDNIFDDLQHSGVVFERIVSEKDRRGKLKQFVMGIFTKLLRTDGEPYYNHLERVAYYTTLIQHEYKYMYEVALLHDMLENIDITEEQLFSKIMAFGYNDLEAFDIISHVKELTDYYTKEKYEDCNREYRKQMEGRRLQAISDESKIIKMCDIFDNIISLCELDETDFNIIYKDEKIRDIDWIHNKSNDKLFQIISSVIKNDISYTIENGHHIIKHIFKKYKEYDTVDVDINVTGYYLHEVKKSLFDSLYESI